jgi:hypothetical protein
MRIIENIRPDRQTVMFSATFPRQMEALARRILTKPIEIQVFTTSVAVWCMHTILHWHFHQKKGNFGILVHNRDYVLSPLISAMGHSLFNSQSNVGTNIPLQMNLMLFWNWKLGSTFHISVNDDSEGWTFMNMVIYIQYPWQLGNALASFISRTSFHEILYHSEGILDIPKSDGYNAQH